MTAIYTTKSDNLDLFLETTGAKASPASADERDLTGKTLAAGTYYAPIGASEALLPGTAIMVAIQARWNAALAAVMTIEACNFPSAVEGSGHGRVDVADFEPTGVNWIQENDAAAGRGYSAGGAGNVLTVLSMAAGGTNAGGVNLYLNNAASRRYRLKVVVTTPGLLRVGACGKE